MLSINIALASLCLVALVNGLSITRREVDTTLPEDTATEPETPTKVISDEEIIKKQRNLLKKLCRPQLTPVYVVEELGPMSDLEDYPLLPEVLAVKRCNKNSYCGEGFHDPSMTCRAIRHRIKNFTIRVIKDTHTVYEKLPIKVDRKCACQRDP